MEISNLQKLDTLLDILDGYSQRQRVVIIRKNDKLKAETTVLGWYTIEEIIEKVSFYSTFAKEEIEVCLKKLEEDRFVESRAIYANEQIIGYEYRITFTGKVFIEQGNYVGHYKREKASKNTNFVIQWTLAGTGIITGYYYLLEIYKNEKSFISLLFLVFILLIAIEIYLYFSLRGDFYRLWKRVLYDLAMTIKKKS